MVPVVLVVSDEVADVVTDVVVVNVVVPVLVPVLVIVVVVSTAKMALTASPSITTTIAPLETTVSIASAPSVVDSVTAA